MSDRGWLGTGLAVWTLGLLACGLATVPLGWDGASYAYQTLHGERPWAPPLRPAATLLEWPVVWAMRLTDDLDVLRVVFSLPWALAPLLAVGLLAAVTRTELASQRRWIGLVGITVVVLAGQPFFVSEAIVACQLAWPLQVAAASGCARRLQPVVGLTAGLMLALHPTAALLLPVIAGTWLARRHGLVEGPRPDGPLWPVWVVSVAIVAASGWRYLAISSPYEANMTRGSALIGAVATGLDGVQGIAWLVVVSVVALALLGLVSIRPATVLLVVSLPIWLWWAAHPPLWWSAILFRFVAAPVTAVFMALAAVSWRTSGRSVSVEAHRARTTLAASAAAISGATLLLVAVTWHTHLRSVDDDLAAGPAGCTEVEFPDLSDRTAAEQFLPAFSLVMGERASTRIRLFRGLNGTCAAFCRTGRWAAPVVGFADPPVDGWFELDGARRCRPTAGD